MQTIDGLHRTFAIFGNRTLEAKTASGAPGEANQGLSELDSDNQHLEKDAGNQQLLENFLGVEENLDEKLQSVKQCQPSDHKT